MGSRLAADGAGRQPLVSVVMNCYNGATYLREAIDSVYAQTYSDWEIVFWDNASADESPVIAQSYSDGRLRYFRGETTVPLGHARNFAMENASGEFIAFLDCDDLWLPEKLEKQVPLFLTDDSVGLVYSDTLFFNQGGTQKRLYAKRKPYRGRCFEDLLNRYLISLETAVLRKAALDSLDHWFDIRFNMIEEYDLFVRIGLDWKIDFVPEVLAKWRVHDQSLSWRAPDSFVDENIVMLDALMRDGRIARAHGAALTSARRRVHLKEAVREWKNGDSRVARRIVRDIPEHDLNSWLVRLASYLPYSMIEPIYHSLSGAVTPRTK